MYFHDVVQISSKVEYLSRSDGVLVFRSPKISPGDWSARTRRITDRGSQNMQLSTRITRRAVFKVNVLLGVDGLLQVTFWTSYCALSTASSNVIPLRLHLYLVRWSLLAQIGVPSLHH